jgi:hypothetical protein
MKRDYTNVLDVEIGAVSHLCIDTRYTLTLRNQTNRDRLKYSFQVRSKQAILQNRARLLFWIY